MCNSLSQVVLSYRLLPCRLRSELSLSLEKVNELTSEQSALRKEVDDANAARDSLTLRLQAQDEALASRDATIDVLRQQLASAIAEAEASRSTHAATVAQNGEVVANLEAKLSGVERLLEESSRAKVAVETAAIDNAATSSRLSDSLAHELQSVSAILNDHLTAESEVAVWYLHSGSVTVASRDVAKAMAALLEETRSRLEELSAGCVYDPSSDLSLPSPLSACVFFRFSCSARS